MNKTYNWTLVEQLHAEGNGYRKIAQITGYQYGAIKSHLQRLKRGGTTATHDNTAPIPLTETELISAEKEKIIRQNEQQIQKERIKEQAQWEIVIDKIRSAITVLPKLDIEPIHIPNTLSKTEEEVILDISDLQVGTKILFETTGGLNEYNFSIFERQIKQFLLSVISICKRHKTIAPIRKAHVFMIGDMVEGMGIFLGQAQHVDQDVYNQCFKLVDLLEWFLIQLLRIFEEIEVSCVVGNHGRIGQKGENPHWVNWDGIMYRTLAIKLENHADRIKFNIPLSWWFIKEIQGKKHLIFHGDDIKGWGGIPFYGINRSVLNQMAMFKTINEEFDYVHIGHLHTPAELPIQDGGSIFVNGCWPGASILALKVMSVTGKPCQWIMGVHPEFGVTWRYQIWL